MYDYIIIGAGIVGLSTAMQLLQKHPDRKVLVLEKEPSVAYHQTGHNSGVIHAGVYYKPGSYKALFAKKGLTQLYDFCQKHDIPHKKTGKMIVAVNKKEIPRLDALYERALQNGLELTQLTPEEIQDREPGLQAVAGFYVATTGVVDYTKVTKKYAEIFQAAGGEIKLSTKVSKVSEEEGHVTVTANGKAYQSKWLVVCAGLQSDRLARMMGCDIKYRIVPFRGEYYEITSDKKALVNGLIYPVPNPDFPFLGVHFTRMHDGSVKVGPNAVLAFDREGYKKPSFSWRDTLDTLKYTGFWRLIGKYLIPGSEEMLRSKCKTLFVKNVQKYFPQLTKDDLHYSQCGIRAQALMKDGKLVDDFLFAKTKRSLHVCNAPSPAATASLAIGEEVVNKVEALGK
jgi:(S)-2-hydroxyglutarate dehydrogenase